MCINLLYKALSFILMNKRRILCSKGDVELGTSKDGMYTIKDNKAIPTKAEEMEWLLRYGEEREILKHRLYIAHIVNLYINHSKN